MTDIGLPGPDRGEGGRYLLVPPGYTGELPEAGYLVNKVRTTRVTMFGRSFLENNDPKPAVALIKKTLKVYPYVRVATARASPRPWKARPRCCARRSTSWNGPS